ncbi:MAG: asparagine synthetase B [Chloroflexi bacterium]|nr:asparagine synthetase B [Chloroflexota bacterium]
MCGICGYRGIDDPWLLDRMLSLLEHRGPDDEGRYVSPLDRQQTPVALGMRRLSIIDLWTGHQPIHNEDGTLWIVYNGEVYNFLELRAALEQKGHRFYTHTDTETIIHAYEEYGTDCVKYLNGMFAFAILDILQDRLFLARDHFGIKPLYYHYRHGDSHGTFLFASEIKPLLEWPDLKPLPDEGVIQEYLLTGRHDHREETFFKGVYRLLPAHTMVVDSQGLRTERYWDIHWQDTEGQTVVGSHRPGIRGGKHPGAERNGHLAPLEFQDITGKRLPAQEGEVPTEGGGAEFARLFRDSVQRRLISDVPLGSCLSGGLDSSAVVCTMADLMEEGVPEGESLGERIKTFSAVYPGEKLDEQEYIQTVLQASGAEANFVYPAKETFFQELEQLVWHQEEPMVSTGPYAQWCVMREVAKKVTVVIDGQGSDELMAGYTPYFFVYFRQLWRERKLLTLARELVSTADLAGPFMWARLKERFLQPRRITAGSLVNPEFARRRFERHDAPPPDLTQSQQNKTQAGTLRQRLYDDIFLTSLPSLLRYEDKNSMAFSVESRLPFLDPRLVEFIFSRPDAEIIQGGWNKLMLREAMRGVLPEKIRRRRWKVGFTTPEMGWLCACREKVLEIFNSESFASRPYFNAPAVRQAFTRICAGQAEETLAIWRILNVELWLRVFFDRREAHVAVRPAQPRQATPN